MKFSITGVLLALLALSLIYAVPFFPSIAATADKILNYCQSNPEIFLSAGISVVLILLGHLIRAYRDTLLFSKAAKTSVGMQFSAFSIGSLCNAIFPMRIGELLRADVIAQHYRISFLFSLVLIGVERFADVVIVFFVAFFTIGFNFPLALVGCVLLVGIGILRGAPLWFKKLLKGLSSLFNSKLEAKFLYSFWSIEYGLKRTLKPKQMLIFGIVSVLNWIVYFSSLIPIVLHFQGSQGDILQPVVASFVALVTAVSPGALGNFTPALSEMGFMDPVFYIVIWIVAIVPTALIGLISAFVIGRSIPIFRQRMVPDANRESLDNKLRRDSDVSIDQLGFMRDYYSGKQVVQEISKREIDGINPALSKYVTAGGSGAITFLSVKNNEVFVTKAISNKQSEALRLQYRWLNEHRHPSIAKAIREYDDGFLYSIDICFENNSVNGYDYVHSHSIKDVNAFFDRVIAVLNSEVWRGKYNPNSYEYAVERVRRYIDKHISASLTLAEIVLPELSEVFQCSYLCVGGTKYPNLPEMMERIQKDEHILTDLANFRSCSEIHGDLICDNLLWSEANSCPIILDPAAKDNFFDGPVFDFGKLSQSLQIGYEFFLRDLTDVHYEVVDNVCFMSFQDMRSNAYREAWEHVAVDLAPKYLNESEQRTMLFLGATNYFRRMKHQAVQFPQNAAKFYAVGIIYLKRYLDLFE